MPKPLPLRELSSVFSSADAIESGIPKRQLYVWRDQGLIEPLGRGLFLQAGTRGDPDLIELAARAPGATLCLASARARHGLGDEIPGTVHLALDRTRRPPRTSAPVTWHRFDDGTFDIDRTEFDVLSGLPLGLYGAARTVIDSFRLRHLEGQAIAIEALRRWLTGRGNHPQALLTMTKHFPTTTKSIRTALEHLL